MHAEHGVNQEFKPPLERSMNFKRLALICLIYGASLCSAYRILAVFPVNGRSHFGVYEQISKALASKGHQVDVISNFPLKEPFPNYTDLVTLPTVGTHAEVRFEEGSKRRRNFLTLHELCRDMCHLLGFPDILKIVKNPPKDPPYDLVMTQFISGYQCFTAIGHLWDVPVVGVVTTAHYPYQNAFIGNPLNLAISSKNLLGYKEDLTFWDRVYNVLVTHYLIHEYHTEAYKHDAIIKQYLGPRVPHYTELEKSVSLLLVNSHYSIYGIQPKTPALVEIGGIHIRNDNGTISADLRKLLDTSEYGFIYVSFGTLMIVESFPGAVIERFFNVFRKIAPIRVIMKSLNPDALGHDIPDNVYTFPWLPQQEILQHPKIRGFVSHGGGLGTQEAVYYGVPIMCFPFFADQYVNCDITSNKKFGIRMDIQTAQQADYDRAFNDFLTNPIYKESARNLSAVFRDRPLAPKEEAVYWVEYIIRHGKSALRSRAVDMKWWQVELLDVYAFLLGCVLTVVGLVIFVARRLIRLAFSMSKTSSKRHVGGSKKLN